MVDWDKIEDKQKQLIQTLNKELGWFNEEELENTPTRITSFYKELDGNKHFNFTTFKPTNISETKSMIGIGDIEFYSLCAHHMLSFFGLCNVIYLPREGGKICGASKIPRMVVKYASAPQIQEKMTNEIADELFEKLDCWFVMVQVKAQHLCMTCRGIKQHKSKMTTSAIRADESFVDENKLAHLKEEAMKMINGGD